MSDFDNRLLSSDLDAYKNSGEIQSASFTFSGGLGAGEEATRSTEIEVEDPDFALILFDNSAKHSGKFKNLVLEGGQTLIHESTRDSELTIIINLVVSGDTITITGIMFNPYDETVSLDSTTINFKHIPYEATF